jgi:hypothetical protein
MYLCIANELSSYWPIVALREAIWPRGAAEGSAMSLDHMQTLAFAAGFGAVSEEDIDIRRDAPPDDSAAEARAGDAFVPGWHMPDAPAPRTALIAHDRSRALAVVEPLWRTTAAAPVTTWAQHLVSVARSMTAYIPGRGMPA